MRVCRTCGGYCDPGDIVGGICTDCLEAERELENRKEWNRKMFARNVVEQSDGQLVMCYAGAD